MLSHLSLFINDRLPQQQHKIYLLITISQLVIQFQNIINKPFDNLIKLEKLTTLDINKNMTTIRPTDLGITNSTINEVPIQSICWSKFKGQVPDCPHYFAHIFWNIQYKVNLDDTNKAFVLPKVHISGRSWARQDKVDDKLLQHQYGHYLIGCLCALKFKQRVQNNQGAFWNKSQALKYCQQIFQQTLNQYLKIQKKYDEQTQHYYNQAQQIKWQKFIASEINKFDKKIKKETDQNINQNAINEVNKRQKIKSTSKQRKNSYNQPTNEKRSQEKSTRVKSSTSCQKTNLYSNRRVSIQKKQSSTSKSISKQLSKDKSTCKSNELQQNSTNSTKYQKVVSMEIQSKQDEQTTKKTVNSCLNIRIRKTSLNYGAYPPLPPIKQPLLSQL